MTLDDQLLIAAVFACVRTAEHFAGKVAARRPSGVLQELRDGLRACELLVASLPMAHMTDWPAEPPVERWDLRVFSAEGA